MIHEAERWLRTLDHVREENVYLKQRFADLMHLTANKHLLKQAEHLQNCILDSDTVNAILRNEIRKHEQQLREHRSAVNVLPEKTIITHRILRNDMMKLEKNFSSLHFDLNLFMDDATDDYHLAA